jgi:hypothetical protein
MHVYVYIYIYIYIYRANNYLIDGACHLKLHTRLLIKAMMDGDEMRACMHDRSLALLQVGWMIVCMTLVVHYYIPFNSHATFFFAFIKPHWPSPIDH